MTDALAALERWTRKYYTATIHNGPNIQPGDGTWVELKAGGRKVVVDEFDCDHKDEDGMPTATIADVILEAIRRWHDDPTPKNFLVYVYDADGEPPPGSGLERYSGRMWQTRVVAPNESAAIDAVAMYYRERGQKLPEFFTYEMTANWTH